MVDERRALRSWEAHLEEVIGVDDAAIVADRFERFVTRDYLDRALDEQTRRLTEQLTGQLAASWRRDLLLVTGAQFFALAAAVAALVSLG